MTLRLGTKRCRRCEGSVHIKDYKLYCDRCGFQPPYDRDGTKPESPKEQPDNNVSHETPWL